MRDALLIHAMKLPGDFAVEPAGHRTLVCSQEYYTENVPSRRSSLAQSGLSSPERKLALEIGSAWKTNHSDQSRSDRQPL